MVSTVIDKLIKVPSKEEAGATAQRFQQMFGMPQIIGCIGVTHILLLLPSDGNKNFVNRKGWPFFVLQPVVDDTNR